MKPEAIVRNVDTMAIREEYPAEEFAGFENFGEFPEWHPGQAGSDAEQDSELQRTSAQPNPPATP